MSYNSIVILGPTATGKTHIAVAMALAFSGQIISCDSRQVYRGLDIGSGKDLAEYHVKSKDGTEHFVKTHLLDIADLSIEYNVYNYQKDFYLALDNIARDGDLPIVVGGTGMYLDSIIRGYNFAPISCDKELELQLKNASHSKLVAMLKSLDPAHHTTTDFDNDERLSRAIKIASTKAKSCENLYQKQVANDNFSPLILGVTLPRVALRSRIKQRLDSRFKEGMIQEVENLVASGISYERLERLGLEYRFIAQYLQGKIASYSVLNEKLFIAICQFAKRQETWFRSMKKKGIAINYLPATIDDNERVRVAIALCKACVKMPALLSCGTSSFTCNFG